MFSKLHKGYMLDFDYRKEDGRLERRTGTFIGLEFGQAGEIREERWFVRMFCDIRKAERSFAIDRIAMVYSIGANVYWERTGNGYRRPE